MGCLTACFGLSKTCDSTNESALFQAGTPRCPHKPDARRTQAAACDEQWDWDGLVSFLTGDVAHGDWWDNIQCATAALTSHLPADHSSIFLLAGSGIAALASSGVPLFGVRFGQLLLPGSHHVSTYSSEDDEQPAGRCEGATGCDAALANLDLTSLAAALQDQTVPVPTLVHTHLPRATSCRKRPSGQTGAGSHNGAGTCPSDLFSKPSDATSARRPATHKAEDSDVLPGSAAAGDPASVDGAPAGSSCRVRSAAASGAGARGASTCSEASGLKRRHFVAVGIPGGKALAGMVLISTTGPAPPASWHQSSGLRTLAALLAPLLRPPQVPLARRSLAELLPAVTINEVVRALHMAATDLMAVSVRVGLQPRVALLRNDCTAAAVFALNDTGTSVCYRRSRDVVLVDAGGSGYHPSSKPQEFFMSERDSLGPSPGGAFGLGAGFRPLAAPDLSRGDPFLQRLPGSTGTGTMGTAGTPLCSAGPGGCRGQSLPLQNTLLLEALTRGSGLCISDCNAYVQDSKAYPRDLMLFKGTTPPQSLALATSCHCGRPLLALYATYHSILPQGLLQAVVQELGQLLRALTPSVASLLLSEGPLAEEWRYLHDHLLGPQAPHNLAHNRQQQTSNGHNCATAAQQQPQLTGAAEQPDTPVAAQTRTTMASPRPPLAVNNQTAGSANLPGAQPVGGGKDVKAADCGGFGAAHQKGFSALATNGVGPTETVGADNRKSRTSVVGDAELLNAMAAAAVALTTGTTAGTAGSVAGASQIAGERLAAFIAGGEPGSVTTSVVPVGSLQGSNRVPANSSVTQAGPLTGRTSFSLEAAGSPRGRVRLAPLISTLHDRVKTAQAEQLTTSSRAASRLQDLESLRFLERVGKGGYGSVYRGLYHGAEVAIKVVEDPATNLTSLSTASLQGGRRHGSSTTLRAKHLHDAIELVASVSMSHPNIVQLITYFVDVRAHQGALRAAAIDGSALSSGTEGDHRYTYDDEPPVQLVHMTSSGLDSTNSSFTEPEGNEAIVLVMEYCDRGSLKDAILDGSFLHREALARLQQQQQQQQQQPQQPTQPTQFLSLRLHQTQPQPTLARGSVALLLNMKAVFSSLLEVALALRHMHGLHVVHCDLKPQNVLLKSSPRDPRGFTAKLSDFGLAKMMAHDEDGQLVISEGIQSGTITHLPPEALTGRRALGPAVDVYAFGIVMFQMLCGMTVYPGMDVKQVVRGVVRHALRPSFPAWVPTEYKDLAQRCWHENPASRPTSLQLVSELEAMLKACDVGLGGPYSRRVGGSIGAGSTRSAAGGANTPGPRRRLPQKSATDTDINGAGRSPLAHGPAAVLAALGVAASRCATAAATIANAAALPPAVNAGAPPAVMRNPSYCLYQPPNQLYHPSPAGSPGAAGGTAGDGRIPVGRQGSTTDGSMGPLQPMVHNVAAVGARAAHTAGSGGGAATAAATAGRPVVAATTPAYPLHRGTGPVLAANVPQPAVASQRPHNQPNSLGQQPLQWCLYARTVTHNIAAAATAAAPTPSPTAGAPAAATAATAASPGASGLAVSSAALHGGLEQQQQQPLSPRANPSSLPQQAR